MKRAFENSKALFLYNTSKILTNSHRLGILFPYPLSKNPSITQINVIQVGNPNNIIEY
jgi:hypothetical protein